MARKPNYSYERNMRAKAKAEKRQAKLAAKRQARQSSDAAAAPTGTPDSFDGRDGAGPDTSATNDSPEDPAAPVN